MHKSRHSLKQSRIKSSKMSWKLVGLISSTVFLVVSAALSVLIWAVHSSSTEAAATPPIVATPIGRFVGVITAGKIYDSSYVAYRSIPFAKPPIDDLRFKRPEPLKKSETDSIINSEQYQKSCWTVTRKSTDPNYGEDCLYLNIYVPGTGEFEDKEKKLPVMVWIHGGGFVAGSTFPEPEKLVLQGNVIVVTINYRLGPFGFLTTQDDDLPSNNGLWDQYMALKWVKDYIRFFHGDDETITLFGESSGAISTALHMISPISSGLFKKAILQSGGATALISRDAKQRAQEFSAMVGCSATAECLGQVSVADILKFSKPSAFNISLAQQQVDFVWMPTIDGKFLPDEPLKLLKNITYLEGVNAFSKDFLIGVLNNEGALIVDHFLNPIIMSNISDVGFLKDLTEYMIQGRYGNKFNASQELKEQIYAFYTGSPLLSAPPPPQSVMDLAADINFIIPAVELALALSRCRNSDIPSCFVNSSESANCSKTSSKTYFYHFDYCPVQTDFCIPTCLTHGSDVAYEFPKTNFTIPVQQQLSDLLVDILTEFARSSKPGTVLQSDWPVFDTSSQSYLRLDSSPSIRQFLYDYRVKFWLSQVPSIAPSIR